MKLNLVIFFIIVAFGVVLQMSEPDYGAFKRDYFEAHLLGMEHLGQIKIFFDQLITIPNSASGVIPLTIMGLLDNYWQRYFLNILLLFLTLLIIFQNSKANHFIFFVSFLTFSPTFMSSLKWLLPEVMSICFVLLLFSLDHKHRFLRYLFSFLVPLFRQTFIVFLVMEGLLRFGKKLTDKFEGKDLVSINPKALIIEYRETLIQVMFGSLGLSVLVYFWGGLVPPKLAAVHNTLSMKASLTAFLIFGLYFTFYCFKEVVYKRSNYSILKIVICTTLSIIFCMAYFSATELLGGGYIFSRLEVIFPSIFYILLFFYVFVLFLLLPIPLVLLLIFFSFSFITTNHMYIKYVDQYMILLFGYFIITPRVTVSLFSREQIENFVGSFLIFQIFSLILAHFYYG